MFINYHHLHIADDYNNNFINNLLWIPILKGLAINNADKNDIILQNICSLIEDNLTSFHRGSKLIKNVVNEKLIKMKLKDHLIKKNVNILF